MTRKTWIDNLRGFCMLAILLDHTELYYAEKNIIDYNLYVVNALVIFFFLSGYLMYKETTFDIKHKLCAICKTLLLPYLIFTTLISIPKIMVHGGHIIPQKIALDIITGQASWFVAALCISELIFALTLWISKGKNTAILACGGCGFAVSIYLSTRNQPYFWQLDNALQALLFMSLGYLYHKYETVFNHINKTSYISLFLLLIIGIKIYEYHLHVNMLIWNIHISNYPLFLLDISIYTLAITQIFKRMPSSKWLSWTGKHSIVYYFLCGGVPLIVSKLLTKSGLPYNGNYLLVILAFMLVYLIATIITFLIYQYVPFILGKKYE